MIAFVFFALQARATIRCGDALMSAVVEGKERVESANLCVESEQREGSKPRVQAIASANCRDEKSEKPCLAVIKAREAKDREARSSFELCLKLGGVPQSIRFQMTSLGAGVWQTTDRCRFDFDYSFLDLSSFAGRGPFKPR